MMDFELKLEKPNVSQAWISAATMGISYFVGMSSLLLVLSFSLSDELPWLTQSYFCTGGLLPMIPYFAMKNTNHALFISIGITVVVCITFGFFKNYAILKTKRAGLYGAAQTLIVGALAAGTSYGIVYGVDHSNIGA